MPGRKLSKGLALSFTGNVRLIRGEYRKASEISNFLNVQHFYKSSWPREVFRPSCAQPGLTLYRSSFQTAQQPPLRTYIEKDVMAGRLFFWVIGLLFVAFFKNTVSEMPGVVKPMKQQIGITVCIRPGFTLLTRSSAGFRTRCLGRL